MDSQSETAETSKHMRIISPKELTQRALRPGDGSQAAMKAVANAEEAIEQLSINFDDWMASEVAKLLTARNLSHDSGFRGEPLEQLFSVAHDLKGQAGTLGYPFAGEICASLCRLVDARQKGAPTSPTLIDQHVDAVRAILHEGAKGHDHAKASALATKLCDVADDYLGQITRKLAS